MSGQRRRSNWRIERRGGRSYLESIPVAKPDDAPSDACVCTRVADVPVPASGSTQGRCVACDAAIWMDPVVAKQTAPKYCGPCALDALASGALSPRPS